MDYISAVPIGMGMTRLSGEWDHGKRLPGFCVFAHTLPGMHTYASTVNMHVRVSVHVCVRSLS